jgi:hypothetical protein
VEVQMKMMSMMMRAKMINLPNISGIGSEWGVVVGVDVG